MFAKMAMLAWIKFRILFIQKINKLGIEKLDHSFTSSEEIENDDEEDQVLVKYK